MRISCLTVLAALLAPLSLAVHSQEANQAAYYYLNGVRHSLRIDPDRRVDLATGSGTAPKIVHLGRSAKALTGTTPLLIDTSTQGEQALPGGVLVTFKPGTSAQLALATLRAHGVSNASAVVGAEVWMVPSDSGLTALNLANRLHESGDFLAAEPNWWRKRRTK
jgi:hypothetical protein